jgi:hypothetical protein
LPLSIVCMVLFSCMLVNGCCWPLFNGAVSLAANLIAMVGDLFTLYLLLLFFFRCGMIVFSIELIALLVS